MKKKIHIGVLVSGEGTNLQSILDACRKGAIDGEVVTVITNRANAGAIARCEKYGIPWIFLDHRVHQSREEYDSSLVEILQGAQVDLVALAGFMRLLTPVIIRAYPGRIMNIHPSLLPSFPGLHPQRQALNYGVRFSGCTVHFVDEGIDTGPIILQAAVPILEEDTEESLARRILEQEHVIYPQAIQLFSKNRLRIESRRVRILSPENQGFLP